MSLNPCSVCGGTPVEQIRGQIKPEDHHMQHHRLKAAEEFNDKIALHGIFTDVRGLGRDTHAQVEDEHARDTPISCPRCGNHIGWDRRDKEEFRNHGPADFRRHTLERDGNLEAIRERWNDANPLKAA